MQQEDRQLFHCGHVSWHSLAPSPRQVRCPFTSNMDITMCPPQIFSIFFARPIFDFITFISMHSIHDDVLWWNSSCYKVLCQGISCTYVVLFDRWCIILTVLFIRFPMLHSCSQCLCVFGIGDDILHFSNYMCLRRRAVRCSRRGFAHT